ncbi:MAG TPA: HAMP domain-containing sensor histidine kinase [Gemmatimonadales bacterium]|jgi:signal transduction histidine kinase
MKSSARALVLLLLLTVALAALLGYEAQRATRSHRVTAEHALRDYATVAGWEFLSATNDLLDRTLSERLGPAVGSLAASPYDSLPPPGVLAAGMGFLRCPSTGSAPLLFALDFRNGSLTTSGAASSLPERSWLRDSLLARAASAHLAAAGRAGVVWDAGAGENLVAVFGVKWLRYSGYAQHDAPLAAYGVVTCPGAFAGIFTEVMRNHPLLPRSVTGGIGNARLVSLSVSTPAGRPFFKAGPVEGPTYAGDAASDGEGSMVVRAALPAEIAGRLVVARPGTRLPLLLGLLALTAGLAVVALRQLRREQELVRMRSDFTSSVSHELRTPLTQILLFAETLELGRAAGEDEHRVALGIIGQEARRLAHLVENVLQFSRAERRMTRVQTQTVALAPLMREIMERFAPLAGSAALRVHAELDEELMVPVHPESLHQIAINLLDNAIKYSGPDGRVCFRSLYRERSARIEVEDTGPGVPPADRMRIWEPFVRLQGTLPVPGSGIGLAVVRDLVLAHGGKVWVEEGKAGGARFVVELPDASRSGTLSAAVHQWRATEV